jgi:2-oxoglutarate dehydrogenase complex dehydrogenase (E1) component-like enzyme
MQLIKENEILTVTAGYSWNIKKISRREIHRKIVSKYYYERAKAIQKNKRCNKTIQEIKYSSKLEVVLELIANHQLRIQG